MYQCDNCKRASSCPGFVYKRLFLPLVKNEMEKANNAFQKGSGLDYLHMDIVCDHYEPIQKYTVESSKPSVKFVPIPFIFIDERGKNS